MKKMIVYFSLLLLNTQLSAMEIEEVLLLQKQKASPAIDPSLQPLIIGNKTISKDDLSKLTLEQRLQLRAIAEPACIDRLYGISNRVIRGYDLTGNEGDNKDYDNLKKMPSHITDGLEISMIDKSTYNCSTKTRCGSYCGVGSSTVLSLIVCWGSCGCCGIIPGCIAKSTALFLMKIAGGLLTVPVACEGCNCLQIHCCAQLEKCEFSSDDQRLTIN
jgi:hypothetical protein